MPVTFAIRNAHIRCFTAQELNANIAFARHLEVIYKAFLEAVG
jgi:hypothetical protein